MSVIGPVLLVVGLPAAIYYCAGLFEVSPPHGAG